MAASSDDRDKKKRIKVLLGAYDRIQSVLFELSPELQQLNEIRPVPVDFVLELAERLSYTAHAPIGWKEGFPLINKFPPAPQPDQMRLGKLAEAEYQDYSFKAAVPSSSTGHHNNHITVTDSQLAYLKNSIKIKLAEQRSRIGVSGEKESALKDNESTKKKARRKANITFNVDSDSDS
eukprot:gene38336-46587_t